MDRNVATVLCGNVLVSCPISCNHALLKPYFRYVAMHAMEEDSASSGHDHHPGSNGYADGPGPGSQRKQSRPQMRDTLATVVGMLLPLLTQFGHH